MHRNLCSVLLLLAVAAPNIAQDENTTTTACSLEGDLRLAGGPNALEGRVEVCFNNRWGTVCDDIWDDRDAQVVCRQLGYSSQGARGIQGTLALYEPGVGLIYLDNVECAGNEEFLVNCSAPAVGDHNCNHFEDAGVLCEEAGFSCEDGDVRLLNSKSMYEGRVEVCRNNKFSTICSDGWGTEEAMVVCNQLEFTEGGLPYATKGRSFGSGVGDISWSQLGCVGNESNFTQCPSSQPGRFCDHSDDIGVLCPQPNASCADGDVRLSGGRISSEGFVEICFNGHWGTVCHNEWDDNDAEVVCGQLGFPRNGSIAIGLAYLGQGDGLILLNRVACTGNESNLNSCPRSSAIGDNFCTHSRDAGVVCVDFNNTCTNGDMRLVDGETPNEGRLEICYDNHWGTVCDDDFDSIEAAVVCRLLGFEEEGAVGLHGAFFGDGIGIIFLDNLECTGNETTLLDCSHLGVGNGNCGHHEDVSVLCQAANSSCINGEIRLVNGSEANSGRVEVCFNGRFGSVCDDDWDTKDAAVVCNQLGYPGEGAIGLSGAYFGQGTGPIFFDNSQCDPTNHSTLISCFDVESAAGVHDCEHSEDASVICPVANRTCGGALNGDVRLANGSNEYEGRVELCLDGEWGTICDNFWSDNDATVVCVQLKYGPTDARSLKGAAFGPGVGNIVLDRVFCDGSETKITDCIHFPADPENCLHGQDVGVVCSDFSCTNGEIRLVGGHLVSEGRVEICIGNQFGTVCDDFWDSKDAAVVCRQLGYNDGIGAVALPMGFFGRGTSQILLDDVDCLGNELDLLSCSFERDSNCFHFEDAGVICESLNDTAICETGDIRLVRGSGPYEGNLEVCISGNWGTVCHDSWDSTNAQTVCTILGYEARYAVPTRLAYFGAAGDEVIIALDEVDCVGNETRILQCPSSNPGDHDCSHLLDAGVICSVTNSSFDCQSGEMRLVGGETPNEGRVEVCLNGEWGTICDDSWDELEASVVCSVLGYGAEDAQAVGGAEFGQGSGVILMSLLACTGNETSLFDCPLLRGPNTQCLHGEDASVICKPPPCFDGEIRLVSGLGAWEGNVEVCGNKAWSGSVCDVFWDNRDAEVVCNQLGYSSQGAVATRGSFFGEAMAPTVVSLVDCSGNESSLLECDFSSRQLFCFSSSIAGVICPTNETRNCTNGDVRLGDGSNEYEGRVELCLHGRWGTVCDDSWDSRDAQVVCRQLGYTGNNNSGIAVAARRAKFGPGNGFIILDEVNCNGSESSLLQCRAAEIGVHNCISLEDSSVYCPYPGSPCRNGDVRLVDGDKNDRGRVEFCVGGVWHTICADNFWTNQDAQTVCRQLGFTEPENAVSITVGGGSGPIQITHLQCTGNEARITDCPVPDFALISIACSSHDSDAGVICVPDIDNTTCYDGEVRLVGGMSANEGRVEVCFNNRWGTICDDSFGREEARVICRQLNYTENINSSLAIGRSFFGQGLVPIHLDDLMCEGGEETLLECIHNGVGQHNCGHAEDAGVVCIAPSPTCETGDVQLVNGPSKYEGRLEVCLGGRWGTVCDDNFDDLEATVVCRQLGFSNNISIATNTLEYGMGEGLIFLDELDCSGSEIKLLACPSNDPGQHNCFHSEDVGVICLTSNSSLSCTSGDTRLVGGARDNEGNVEMCLDDQWTSVCIQGWDKSDTAVLCNSLGYGRNKSLPVLNAFFGRGSTSAPSVSGVDCVGNETDLFSCTYTTPGICNSVRDIAGVICPPVTPVNCTDGDIRLIGGTTQYEGRVEMCLHGYWGGVCPSDTHWGYSDATVVCRQLGYTENGYAVAANNFERFESSSRSLYVLGEVQCAGSEATLIECSASALGDAVSCSSFEVAGVFCPDPTSNCTNGDVRLMDKRNEYSGRVEFCVGGFWRSLCADEFWTDGNAQVVCRQLGYENVESAVSNVVLGFFFGTDLFLTSIDCLGDESTLASCDLQQTGSFTLCIFNTYAAVICLPPDPCTNDDIRLVDGAAEFEGRVEVCFNNKWGTVCDDLWGSPEAQVVCRQLGFSDVENSVPFSNAFFGVGIVPIHLDEVSCVGNERLLSECEHSGVGIHNCGHHEDAGVICVSDNATNCTYGELRLVGGVSDLEGRLEVCAGGRWGTVCDDEFDRTDAGVVCRQLGYYPESATLGDFADGSGLIFLDNVACIGNETRLFDCPHNGLGAHNCFHDEDVGVRCTEPPTNPTNATTTPITTNPTITTTTTPITTNPTNATNNTVTPAPGCVEGSVELTGGTLATEGTVQLCMNGQWGTICDDHWETADATVVCRQLGLMTDGAVGVRGAFFGPGEGPIHIRSIHCVGPESSITDCAVSNSVLFCGHHEDSGVICPPEQPQNCTNGDVRLGDGSNEYEGRVELCLHGRWGTVCDDSWDSRDAQVVCRQLGYTENGLPWAAHGASFGAGDGFILLDEVACQGTENSLLACRASDIAIHNCRSVEDAGVFCPYPGLNCSNGEVRLVNGDVDSGRVEVCVGGMWSTVCADINWDDREARTICRQLGYTNLSDALALSGAVYGEGKGPILLGSLNCSGEESELFRCNTFGGVRLSCVHANDAGVICLEDDVFVCNDGDIQLVNGATKNEGRVEICFNNHWGTICDDQWGPQEATVVCRQLGYGDGEGAVAIPRAFFGEGTGRIHLDDVNCERTETSLMQCPSNGVSEHNCGHSEDAGVICIVANATCVYGELRLVGGVSDLEGRLEVCIGGRWGTVCDDDWDEIEARVVCRQLGFSQDGGIPLRSAFFGQGTGPIFFDESACFGNESMLIDCPSSGVAVHNCQHSEDASVICQPLPCTDNNVRLVGGLDQFNGIPQVCANKLWGSICTDNFNSQTASVICGGLNSTKIGAFQVPSSLFKLANADTSNTFSLNVTCDHDDCSFAPISLSTCASFAGVLCPSILDSGAERVCRSGEVRLGGGVDASQGRVEVCFNNIWGTVCDDSWDDNAAAVVCRQLGLPSDAAFAEREGKFGPGVGPIYLDDVKCSGTESHILECSQLPLASIHNCAHSEDATVACPEVKVTTTKSPPSTKQPSVDSAGQRESTVAIVVPLVLIIILLILIILVVVIIFFVYKARKSGKLSSFRGFDDERPIVSSESFSSEAPINKDLELTEKTDQF